MKKSFSSWLKEEKKETTLLFRSIPSAVVSLFVVSVISMNLLANKTLVQNEYIALDGGILISWLSFMCMDIITKYFGPKASNKVVLLASAINLLTCLIFYVASAIPSDASDYTALNNILGGTWFILLSSTIAFVVSAVLNNILNWLIGKSFKKNPNGRLAYAVQTYVSTFIGQFLDNLIFSMLVFMIFAPIFWDGFSWTAVQCTTCALTGAVAELIMEVIFSPIGYKVIKKWRSQKVGEEYLQFIKGGHTMKVLITGTSQGIGKAIAEKFLKEGHMVEGIDRQDATIEDKNYTHHKCDVRDKDNLPQIDNLNILINNAGTQNEEDIDINLKAVIHITEKYGVQKDIKSILNIGSASAHTGAEFPEYCASKAGLLAYTKNVAVRVAKFGATCNSLDPGGVITPLNDCVINDPELWAEIMDETPLRRWATAEEMADWAYFLTIDNKFCTGQSILVDGGESINYNFVWKD